MEGTIKLAAMECSASCVLTYLQKTGHDPSLFLLDYWSLTYLSQVLVSGKHMRLYPLSYLYGVQMEYEEGGRAALLGVLERQGQAMLVCKASGLPFFPRQMLTHEDVGFSHTVLITGYEAESDCLTVIDPIAEYEGTIAWNDLQNASRKQHLFQYYTLYPPTESFTAPSAEELFAYATERNLAAYTDRTFAQCGGLALDKFLLDALDARNWEPERRDAWIYQNNISLSSIIKTRGWVWESFAALGLLNEADQTALEHDLREIQKHWTALNFLLIKFKRNVQNAQWPVAIRQSVSRIKQTELDFLQRLQTFGKAYAGEKEGARCSSS